MKIRSSLTILLPVLLMILPGQSAQASPIMYREQYYQLYHRHLYADSMDIAENIHWLELALRADFANPLNALAKVNNETEWAKYRDLFTMHINLKLVDLYLQWARRFYKFDAYFYNYPWKDANLESLDKAEALLNYALVYWDEAQKYAASAGQYKWLFLDDVSYWEDELYRIQTGDLDYRQIIEHHLSRLQDVRSAFQAMDENTY